MSALGVSGTSLNYLTDEAMAQLDVDLNNEVPYVAFLKHKNHQEFTDRNSTSRIPVWESMPERLWRKTRAAKVGGRQLVNRLDSEFTAEGVHPGVTTGEDKYDRQILLSYMEWQDEDGTTHSPGTQYRKLKNNAPSSMTIEVERNGVTTSEKTDVVVERNVVTPASGCGGYYNGDYELTDIPGGIRAESATLGTPAINYKLDDEVMIHCGHVTQNNYKLAQPYGNNDFARHPHNRFNYSTLEDWGFYTPRTFRTLSWKLGNDYGGVKDPDIVGIVTNEKLTRHIGDPYWLLDHQGITTGHSTGTITSILRDRWVETNCDGWSGDSGSPLYRHREYPNLDINEFMIAGILSSVKEPGNCPYPYAAGNTIQHIEYHTYTNV